MGLILTSTRLREAGNVRAGVEPQEVLRVSGLLFSLADRAEVLERLGIDPIDNEIGWNMVFAHAVNMAGEIIEEFGAREDDNGSV